MKNSIVKFLLVLLVFNMLAMGLYTVIKELTIKVQTSPLEQDLRDLNRKISVLDKKLGQYRSNTVMTPVAIKIVQHMPKNIVPNDIRIETTSKTDDIKERTRYYYTIIRFDGTDIKKSINLYLAIMLHPMQYKITRVGKGRIDVIFREKIKKTKNQINSKGKRT